MAGLTRGEAAAEALLLNKEELAQAITAALYRDRPELLGKHGERGRLKCLQDMRYNLEHLAPAVALGEPSLFGRYVAWLAGMLAARGIPAGDVRRSLELTCDAVAARLPADEATRVVAAIGAGIAALDAEVVG
jgi:MerR family transcriptional regulator, light-induced transcriptional regulator